MPAEIAKEVEEMKIEWHEFKNKALWLLLGSVGVLVTYGIWVGTMQTNISQIQKDQMKADAIHEQITERVNNLEVTNGEIRARLSSIDATLLEIKAAIKLIR